MPGQRAAGQKLVPIPMSDRFRDAIDKAYRKAGYDSRAKFVRDAVEEKLRSMGYPVEKEDTAAPSRTKGTTYPRHNPAPFIMNEGTNLKLSDEAIAASDEAEAEVQRPDPKLPPSGGAGGTNDRKSSPSRGTSRKARKRRGTQG